MRLLVAVLLSLPLALATPTPGPALAPLHKRGEALDDAYIVVFKKGIQPHQIALHLSGVDGWHGANPLFTFTSDGEQLQAGGINHVYLPTDAGFGYFGYAGSFSESTLHSIRSAPEVAYVEHDQLVYTQDIPRGVDNHDAVSSTVFGHEQPTAPGFVTETGAPWGLARLSHRPPLTLSTFSKYVHHSDGGEGVTAYIIDTGINVDHVEFEGRAKWGKTIPKHDVDKDGNGHGTHCAGTVGSRKSGVAKKENLLAVKFLGSNGYGTMSDVVAGVVWAAEHAAAAAAEAAQELAATGKTKHKGSVANMSLGGGKAQSLDDAVDAAVESGLHFAVAAGNDDQNACNYSPASSERAITVGASTLGDERAYFSNKGKCVDIFAPGLNILSTWIGGNDTSNTISGTSMASPHIAGLLAYLLSIHGTDTFHLDSNVDDEAKVLASLYARAYSILPHMAQSVLPVPAEHIFRPTPPRNGTILCPFKLKKAVLGLASPGMLIGLPTDTTNLLAFNNATIAEVLAIL